MADRQAFKSFMKTVLKSILNFLRKEWFLLIAVGSIALIILLFEFL
jgi:hypothetical protein